MDFSISISCLEVPVLARESRVHYVHEAWSYSGVSRMMEQCSVMDGPDSADTLLYCEHFHTYFFQPFA